MISPIRGLFTFFGVVAASFLIWLSTQLEGGTAGYWERLGVLAAAGLSLVVAQVFGGWVLLAGQPDDNWFQRHVLSWSGDLHVERLVRHLRERYLGVIAFGLGAVLGFSFDTTGPRRAAAPPPPPAEHAPEPIVVAAAEPEPEPIAAEHPLAPPPEDAPSRQG